MLFLTLKIRYALHRQYVLCLYREAANSLELAHKLNTSELGNKC